MKYSQQLCTKEILRNNMIQPPYFRSINYKYFPCFLCEMILYIESHRRLVLFLGKVTIQKKITKHTMYMLVFIYNIQYMSVVIYYMKIYTYNVPVLVHLDLDLYELKDVWVRVIHQFRLIYLYIWSGCSLGRWT